MANASQWLEEGSGRWPPPAGPYSEAQRLALEELVAGGPEALRAFLRREQLPPFLSEPEVQDIARAALPPAAGPEPAAEPSAGASLDASSLTYFPERSDLEPPALELGWPGFASGAFRGLTRVEAHFQPGCGDSIYGCKEAVRRQIRSARQVSARSRLRGFPGPPRPAPLRSTANPGVQLVGNICAGRIWLSRDALVRS
uniref:Scaffolding anchor of CK1 domain-containing protein n=1 Tax=Ficedula albicollis TaxID=59894 RepID=A0A803VC37_FICAL